MGAASHIYRYHRGTAFNQGFVGGITKAFGGPIFSDYADAIQYSSTPYDLAVQNMPFYGALSPEARRELRKWAQVKHHQHYGKPKKNLRSIKSKGGVVEDVLNVISEPDERKIRGLPNTYSGMAGVLFQDEEERGAFATGGKVSIKDTDQMYGYLTKDEDEYNVVIDKDPIRVYTKKDFPDLHIKETYYTGFKGNTVSDRLNSVRHSSTIGLPVTTNKKKARGVVQAAGKIKFNNVLKLNIDIATPDAVQAELNKNMDSLIKIEDKILGKEIIQAANDNLAIRDAVLNKDSNRTPEKEAVIARNKSFLVRHQLLKLGYDAIETKEGYTLLRENQFLPTEIMKRKTRLTRRLKYRNGLEVSDISPRNFFEEQQYSWEGDHGNVPMPTNDAREQQLSIEERSKDIAFGHKVTNIETEAGLIHGIPFIDKETGKFIDLTEENKRFIKQKDILQNVNLALSSGWNTKLQERGLTWEEIPDKYKLPLEDLAYNVGGRKAGETWTNIFNNIQNDNVSGFVKNLRRQDAGQNTAGMDNRAAKAAAASGLITSYEQALEYGLELATERRLPFLSKIFDRQQLGFGGRLSSKLSKILIDLTEETLPPPKKTEALDMLNNPSKVDEWKVNNKVSTEESKRRKARKFPEQATALEEEGTMSGKEYRTYLKENQPAATFLEEDLNTMMPNFSQVVGALKIPQGQSGILGLNTKIKKGTRTKSRLDIPAYNDYDMWVASIIADAPGKKKTIYGRTAVLSDVTFDMSKFKKKALKIAKGKDQKSPFAVMEGNWEDLTDEQAFALAKKYINDPEWTQVGFNPERASYFYDKKTMLPVFDAELVIQIGPLVLAKQKKLTPARSLERMLKIRKLRMETRAEGARPAIFNKGGLATVLHKRQQND